MRPRRSLAPSANAFDPAIECYVRRIAVLLNGDVGGGCRRSSLRAVPPVRFNVWRMASASLRDSADLDRAVMEARDAGRKYITVASKVLTGK